MARSRLVMLAALAVSVGSTAFGADAPPATQPAPKPVAGDGTYAVPTAAQVQAWYALNKPAVAGGIYSLDQFGKVGNAKDAQAAFAAAEEHIISSGGGILLIPIETDWNWRPQSTGQRELRTPAPPASTKNWREGVGMTIFDARGNKPTLYPAPITGLTIKRVLDLKQGVNAYDVSDGVPGVGKGNLLRLSPAPFTGTAFDFEPGDPIEQAIGPDPFHPQTMRTWTWDQVPSMFPGKYFDIANNGEVQRHTVLGVRSGSGDLARDIDYRWTHTSVFDRILDINGTSQNAIVFGADVANAALQFKQPHMRAQPIKWSYGRLPIEPAAEDSEKSASTAPPAPIAVLPGVASLTVAPESGVMTLEALAVAAPSGVTKASGLSGSDIRANNLRGIKVPVKAGAKELVIKFAKPEADGEYAVFIETSWITQRAVVEQTADGFTVKFDAAPVADAKLHWMIVR